MTPDAGTSLNDPKTCAHEQFVAAVDVNRMLDTGRFLADVRIKCVQCDSPFRFLGVAAGIAWDRPACSINETELHVPIEPEGEPRLPSSARFEMPPSAA